MVDTRDLKSLALRACRFESGRGYQYWYEDIMNKQIKFMTFDLPYFKCKMESHNLMKDNILSLINNMPEKYLQIKNHSNISKVDWEVPRGHSREYLSLLEPNLFNYMNTLVENTEYDSWKIHNIWFQQYEQNGEHGWHVHNDCQFTNVYYLELPSDTPKTQIINPFTQKTIDLEVEEGDVITFPSFVIHKAPLVESKSRKTIISFNSDFTLSD